MPVVELFLFQIGEALVVPAGLFDIAAVRGLQKALISLERIEIIELKITLVDLVILPHPTAAAVLRRADQAQLHFVRERRLCAPLLDRPHGRRKF
jgi:hypothetical protein